MNNPQKERLLAKLKFWETPGFAQFIDDLDRYKGKVFNILGSVEALKRIYKSKIKEIEDRENKFKQGKLPL